MGYFFFCKMFGLYGLATKILGRRCAKRIFHNAWAIDSDKNIGASTCTKNDHSTLR